MIEKRQPVWVLIFTISLGATCAVLIAPALTEIRDYFHVSSGQSQQLVAIFLLGYAISQLISGPISNSIGRKNILFFGFLLGIVAVLLSILAIFLKNFEILYLLRGIMGLGVGTGVSISMAIVNETFEESKARKVMAVCVASFALAPGIGSCIGGLISQYLGFLFCFVFLCILTLFNLLITTKLVETLPISMRVKFSIKQTFMSYYLAFRNKKIIASALVYGLPVACMYLIVALVPFIAIQNLGISPSVCGILILVSYMGYFLGSFIPGILNVKFKPLTVVYIGTLYLALISLGLLVLEIGNMISVFSLFSLIFLFFLGTPLIYVNISVYGISNHFDKATASSVLMFIVAFLSFLSLHIGGTFHDGFECVLTFGCFLASILTLLIFVIFIKKENS